MDSQSAILGEKPRASIIRYKPRRHTHTSVNGCECDGLLIKKYKIEASGMCSKTMCHNITRNKVKVMLASAFGLLCGNCYFRLKAYSAWPRDAECSFASKLCGDSVIRVGIFSYSDDNICDSFFYFLFFGFYFCLGESDNYHTCQHYSGSKKARE